MAGNGGDVDDGAFAPAQGRGKAPGQFQGGEEIQFEDIPPSFEIAVETAQTFLERRFRRHPGVVDEPMQGLFGKGLVYRFDKIFEAVGVGKVGGNMKGPVGVALAFGRHVLARTGDDTPAPFQEAEGGGVTDATAGAGDDDDFAACFHFLDVRTYKDAIPVLDRLER